MELFQNDSQILDYYQERFRYIMVDEYQDTNTAQFKLISLLASKYGNLCVVGDDDQSIYRFRGADIENILSFEQTFPGARVIKLEQNYRSTQNILDAANGVIRHNRGRKEKSCGQPTEQEMRSCLNSLMMQGMRRIILPVRSETVSFPIRIRRYFTVPMPSPVC